MRRRSLIVLVATVLVLSACGDDSPTPDEPSDGGQAAPELVQLYVSLGYGEDIARCYAEAYGAEGEGVDTQDELNALIATAGAAHLVELASCDAEFGG